MLVVLLTTSPALAAKLTLDRPGDREFVRDTTDLLSPGQVRELQQRCDQLLTDTDVPMFVVTIDSMAAFGGGDMTIETFARTLFEDWGQTHPLMHGQDWTNGVLLVISMRDRAARIELGRAWAGTKDAEARRVMDEHLIPAFRAGDYPRGIAAGVTALDKMARGEAVPARPVPLRVYGYWAAFVGLAAFTFVSLARRGSSGWAWAFWGFVLVVLAAVLFRATRDSDGRWTRTSSSSNSGWSSGGGGSFGGGGGASGSW